MNYPEDDFDLETFKQGTVKNRIALFREKHAFAMRIVTFIIAAASFVAAFFLYDILNTLIERLRLMGFLHF